MTGSGLIRIGSSAPEMAAIFILQMGQVHLVMLLSVGNALEDDPLHVRGTVRLAGAVKAAGELDNVRQRVGFSRRLSRSRGVARWISDRVGTRRVETNRASKNDTRGVNKKFSLIGCVILVAFSPDRDSQPEFNNT